MTHLMQSLREHHPIKTVAIRVIEALHSFYTPQDLDRSVYHTFAEPLVAFMASSALQKKDLHANFLIFLHCVLVRNSVCDCGATTICGGLL